MHTWSPITYVYTSMQYITQFIYSKQVIEDELNRSKYGKKVLPTLNENKIRFIIKLLNQVNTFYYNQSYFQYIWNLTVTIFIFKILWSVLPMAITCVVNWLKKKSTTQLQYVRHELNNTSTHSTTNHSTYQVIFGRKPKIPIDLMVTECAENNGEGEVTVDLNATETENNYNVQPTKNKSFLDSRSDTETESES
ncbi:hypothetical protein BpHYR1_051488 [Brachionus plicatilis]|uniref:Uncharacterized protein n=1 Tax=Brachionus plicatilis TaxID=10195 RepID=A0A3M7QJ32_BRAPC|nr:hypothetical protein BpHYR1_051488 [Brachionus plicatilis]